MEFTEEELSLIKKASDKVNQIEYVRLFIIITLPIGMFAFLFGWIKDEHFLYVTYFIIFVMIVHAKSGPDYNNLVKLLLSKSNTK